MKKPKTPGIVTVAITTTITVIFWVFIALYQILTSKPDPVVDPQLLADINPTLDTALLDSLDQKIFFDEGQAGPPLPSNLEIETPETSSAEPEDEEGEIQEDGENTPEDNDVTISTAEAELIN